MLDFKGKAKWEAWNGRKGKSHLNNLTKLQFINSISLCLGLSSDEAMTKYVEKATGLAESLGVN